MHDGLFILASAMLTPQGLATHTSTSLGMVYAAAAAGGATGATVLALTNTRRQVMTWLLLSALARERLRGLDTLVPDVESVAVTHDVDGQALAMAR